MDQILFPGTLIGLQRRYILGEVIGQGAMGCVYEARDQKLGRDAAIKVLHGQADAKSLQRVYREARAAQLTQHDGVVQTYEADTDPILGRCFVVMERLKGLDLGKRLQEGRLAIQEIQWLALQLADVLRAVHAAKVIHRDLKPANIFLATDAASGQKSAKLLDFGIAKLQEWSTLTTEGSSRGTPQYMAPEYLADPAALDPRVDLYALGAVLYECATHKPPYGLHEPLELVLRQRLGSIRDVREERPELPHGLAQVITGCLDSNPSNRPPDADSVYQALLRA